MARYSFLALALLALIAGASAKVYFEETFDDSWSERWTKSKWKVSEGTAGDWVHTAGKHFGDEEINKGIKTTPDARFYATSAAMAETFDNEGKDLVLQFSVKHEQGLDCGGGYIKLVPESSADQMENFSGDVPYSIMFGPDQCGMTKRVHVIFTYKGKNLLIKKEVKPKDDTLTHVYTLIVKSDNTYIVKIDNEEVQSGSLYEDWDFLPPKTIPDPEASKPEDWDERPKIEDPEAVKPEDWDSIPETIPDPEAAKPEDWDDEDDGEWEPPMIPNPDYKGEWKAPMIDNPDYKGIWKAPEIDNPEFVDDEKLYHFADTKFVAFELWQVKSGSIFDNILVTDDIAYAEKFAEDTWGATKEAEKASVEKEKEEEAAKAEEERKKAEEERKKLEEEEEDEGDAEEDEEYEAEEEETNAKDEL